MKNYTLKRQAGMTLIELTVVLLILVGLAGLLIPYVSSFTTYTHDTTSDHSLASLNNAMQRFQSQYNAAPDNLENLISSSAGSATDTNTNCVAAVADDVFCKLLNPALFDAELAATYPGIALQLKNAGISTVYNVDNTTTDATFKATGSNSTTATSSVTAWSVIKDQAAVNNLGVNVADELSDALGMNETALATNSAGSIFVALGVGQQSQLTGNTISDAPVHFATTADLGPAAYYNRFVAIYEITRPTSITTTSAAKFIGTVIPKDGGHLWGLSHSLSHTYEHMTIK
jgi:type II secretory pathway pseudopilin PulG